MFSQGHYIYIETSYPRRDGDNAKIELRNMKVDGRRCLQFYYHMYGGNIDTLNVFVGEKRVFTKKGPQGNTWKKASVQFTGTGAKATVSYFSLQTDSQFLASIRTPV